MFVAAAGNSGSNNDNVDNYPSNYVTTTNSLVAVASHTRTDGDSGFSYGIETVDIAAPGTAILSTIPGDGYATYSGTSMATPHVTGAAALVWSLNPELTPSEMKELLMSTGETSLWADGRTVSGNRLNVLNALEEADPTPGFKLGITPGSAEIEAGETYTFTIEVGSIAGYEEEVQLSLAEPSDIASLSASSAMPGDTVTLTVETSEDTPWGPYSFTVNGVSGDIEKSKSANLYVYPQGLNEFPYAYSGDAVPTLPNEEDPDDVGVDLVINVPDDLTVFGMQASVDITHTYSGDLVLSLTSPQGTTTVLRQNQGGATDDIVESYNSDAVTLTVTDSEGQTSVSTETVSVSDSNIVAEIDRAMLSRFGSLRVDLSYSGSMADTVMIYRNGELLEEVSNTGRYRDRSRGVQPGEYTYLVCDETSACSAPVSVNL